MKNLTSSIIICTRNRPTDIITVLNSIQLQKQQSEELIIVDSSSTQLIKIKEFNAAFTEKNFSKTKLLYRHCKPGLTYQRNIGVSLASCDIVHFVDDDSLLEPHYIMQMNSAFKKHSTFLGGMGTITNINAKSYNLSELIRWVFMLPRCYASGNFTLSGMPTHAYGTKQFKTVQVLGGCCMSYRKSVFKKHKFDENLTRYAYMEDADFSKRVSIDGPLFFNPKAKQRHMRSPLERDRVIDNRAMFIYNYSYLFYKNIYIRNRLTIFAYCWSVIGLLFEAIMIKNGRYLKGYLKGLRQFYFKKGKR